MALVTILWRRFRRYKRSRLETKSLRLKTRLCIFNICCFSLASYFFIRHNTYCEPGSKYKFVKCCHGEIFLKKNFKFFFPLFQGHLRKFEKFFFSMTTIGYYQLIIVILVRYSLHVVCHFRISCGPFQYGVPFNSLLRLSEYGICIVTQRGTFNQV